MAKLTMFTLCDSVNNIPGPQGMVTHLVSPQVVLRPLFIPGNFSFGIAVGVRGLDLKEPIKLNFSIISPDGEVIQNSGDTELPAMPREDTLPPEHQGIMLNLDIRNMVVKSDGVYKFFLNVNGESLEGQEIPIFRGHINDEHN